MILDWSSCKRKTCCKFRNLAGGLLQIKIWKFTFFMYNIKAKNEKRENFLWYPWRYIQTCSLHTLSTFVRRLERMEPLTWRKEGISNHWAGPRGFRKSCCKVLTFREKFRWRKFFHKICHLFPVSLCDKLKILHLFIHVQAALFW